MPILKPNNVIKLCVTMLSTTAYFKVYVYFMFICFLHQVLHFPLDPILLPQHRSSLDALLASSKVTVLEICERFGLNNIYSICKQYKDYLNATLVRDFMPTEGQSTRTTVLVVHIHANNAYTNVLPKGVSD